MISQEFLTLRRKIIEKDFSRMNDMQKQAIFHVDGPLLILAGAGSGKTTVLVNRIASLVKYGRAYSSDSAAFEPSEEDIRLMRRCLDGDESVLFEIEDLLSVDPAEPWQILAITFTNKAANELKDRLSDMLGSQADEIWASTFHSCCSRILRRHADKLGFTSSFTIYDADDSKRLIKECLHRLGLSDSALSVKSILNEISRCKDCLITPEEYISQAGADARKRRVGSVYEEYTKQLKKADAMDFDDMICHTVRLLERFDDVREYYQRRFKYIMVDEYQDTNHAQFRLTELLAAGWGNICVVGDDDQSIYRFRGATIENIMGFEFHYPKARVIRLEQNYRSTQTILDAANSVISNNSQRKGKNLWTDNGKGEKITLFTADTERMEAEYIVEQIGKNLSEGDKLSDHAVLYRMNAQSNSLESAFARSGIAYRIIGGHRFYDRAEIRDLMAYLSVIDNPADDMRLSRIINVPKRGIGTATVNRAFEIASVLGLSVFEVISNPEEYEPLRRSAQKLKAFTADMSELIELSGSATLDELFKALLEKTKYLQYLEADKEKGAERTENVSELASNLVTFELEHEQATLSDFLQEVSLMTDIDNYNAQADAVVLMTIHSAKGLEFPNVFLPGLEEGIFPGMQSMYSPQELEEERRLAYVAITRAKKRLYISHANLRMIFGSTSRNQVSRFVTEIPSELLQRKGVFGSSRSNELYHRSAFSKSSADPRFPPAETLASRAKTKSRQPKPCPISYSVGDRVVSPVFGGGTVLSLKPMGSDTMLEIAFDNVGTKKLMANYARLGSVKLK